MKKANRRSTSFSPEEINYLQQLFRKLLSRSDIEVLIKRDEFHGLFTKFMKMHESCTGQAVAQTRKNREYVPFRLVKS
jgi:hypothetical protein